MPISETTSQIRATAAASDQRKNIRVPTGDNVTLWELDPPSEIRWTARLLDVSKNGFSIIAPIFLEPGSLIRVDMRQTGILARVRHCRVVNDGEEAGSFQVGAEIQHVF